MLLTNAQKMKARSTVYALYEQFSNIKHQKQDATNTNMNSAVGFPSLRI
jgi:hypothetical protein